MSTTKNQDFVRGTTDHQTRVLNITGIAVLAVISAIAVAAVWILPQQTSTDGMTITMEVPYVGPGVGTGTAVILRGADVGQVTELHRDGSGPIKVQLSLEPGQIDGITNTFDIDFRPKNYFGSTAVNLVAKPGGAELVTGEILRRMPAGDYTMSTMLEKSSLTIDGTLTSSMIATLDKVIQYTDGLTPMIETGIIVSDRVAKAQQQLPSELLFRFNNILETLPGFTGQAIETMTFVYNSTYNRLPDGTVGVIDSLMKVTDEGLALAAGKLFGQAGALLASHDSELTPVTQIVAQLSGTLPAMLDGPNPLENVRSVLDRYEAAFTDNGQGKTLNLHIVLDDFPALSTPLAVGSLPRTGGGASR